MLARLFMLCVVLISQSEVRADTPEQWHGDSAALREVVQSAISDIKAAAPASTPPLEAKQRVLKPGPPTADGFYLVTQTSSNGRLLELWFRDDPSTHADDVRLLSDLRDRLLMRGLSLHISCREISGGRSQTPPPLAPHTTGGRKHVSALEVFHQHFGGVVAGGMDRGLRVLSAQMLKINGLGTSEEGIAEGTRVLTEADRARFEKPVKGDELRQRFLTQLSRAVDGRQMPDLANYLKSAGSSPPPAVSAEEAPLIAMDAEKLLGEAIRTLPEGADAAGIIRAVNDACWEAAKHPIASDATRAEAIANAVEHTGRWLMVAENIRAADGLASYLPLGLALPSDQASGPPKKDSGEEPPSQASSPPTPSAAPQMEVLKASISSAGGLSDLPRGAALNPVKNVAELAEQAKQIESRTRELAKESIQTAKELGEDLKKDATANHRVNLEQAVTSGLSAGSARELATQLQQVAEKKAAEAKDLESKNPAAGNDGPAASAREAAKNLQTAAKTLKGAADKGMATAEEVRDAVDQAKGKKSGDTNAGKDGKESSSKDGKTGSGKDEGKDGGKGGDGGSGGGPLSLNAPLFELLLKLSGYDALAKQLAFVIAALNLDLLQDLVKLVEKISSNLEFLNDLSKKLMPLANLYQKYGDVFNAVNAGLERLQREGFDRMLEYVKKEAVNKLKEGWEEKAIGALAANLPEELRGPVKDALRAARGIPDGVDLSKSAEALRDHAVKAVRQRAEAEVEKVVEKALPPQLRGVVEGLDSIKNWDPADGLPPELAQNAQRKLQEEATRLLTAEIQRRAKEKLGIEKLPVDDLVNMWAKPEQIDEQLRKITTAVGQRAVQRAKELLPEQMRPVFDAAIEDPASLLKADAAQKAATRLADAAVDAAQKKVAEQVGAVAGTVAPQALTALLLQPGVVERLTNVDASMLGALAQEDPAKRLASIVESFDRNAADVVRSGMKDAIHKKLPEAMNAMQAYAAKLGVPGGGDKTLEDLGKVSMEQVVNKALDSRGLAQYKSLPLSERLQAVATGTVIPGLGVTDPRRFAEHLHDKLKGTPELPTVAIWRDVLEAKATGAEAWAEAEMVAQMLRERGINMSVDQLLAHSGGPRAAALESIVFAGLAKLRTQSAAVLAAAGKQWPAMPTTSVEDAVRETQRFLREAAESYGLVVSKLLSAGHSNFSDDDFRFIQDHWTKLGEAQRAAFASQLAGFGLSPSVADLEGALNDQAMLGALLRRHLMSKLGKETPADFVAAMGSPSKGDLERYVQSTILSPLRQTLSEVIPGADVQNLATGLSTGQWDAARSQLRRVPGSALDLGDAESVRKTLVGPIQHAFASELQAAKPEQVDAATWGKMIASRAQEFGEDDLKTWILNSTKHPDSPVKALADYAQRPSIKSVLERMRRDVEAMKMKPGRDPMETLKMLQPSK
jgi:hypothetical protein